MVDRPKSAADPAAVVVVELLDEPLLPDDFALDVGLCGGPDRGARFLVGLPVEDDVAVPRHLTPSL